MDVAGIEFSENDYQQKAIVCNIRSSKDFENTTWQRFLSASTITLLSFINIIKFSANEFYFSIS
jgi:2-octaprenyl-3-methyl-6-methoxy-1,4-benzoquinol hydroxylase/2-octaprenylphenol hydroxylase